MSDEERIRRDERERCAALCTSIFGTSNCGWMEHGTAVTLAAIFRQMNGEPWPHTAAVPASIPFPKNWAPWVDGPPPKILVYETNPLRKQDET